MSLRNHSKLGHTRAQFPFGCGTCKQQQKADIRELCTPSKHTIPAFLVDADGRTSCLCGLYYLDETVVVDEEPCSS